MTGTNSSNDSLILRQNVEINSNEYFSCDVIFREWNRQPRGLETSLRNHQESSEIFQIPIIYHLLWFIEWSSMWFFIYSSFVTTYDVNFLFFLNLSVIMEVLFSVRCLRCVVVARMLTNIEGWMPRFWDNICLSCQLNRLYNTAGDKRWCPYAR